MRSTLGFVGRALFIALLVVLGINIPELVVAVYRYCITNDTGYMWAINIAISACIAFIIPKTSLGGLVNGLITAISFLSGVILCESIIWHRADMWTIVTKNLSMKELGMMGVGILISTVAYVWTLFARPPKHYSKGKHGND